MLGEPIARGRTAEIFALPRRRVLKLYLPGVDPLVVANERTAQRWAQRQGLPVPRTGMPKSIDGRCGFVMERVDGTDGMTRILRNLEGFTDEAVKLAELQVLVNHCSGSGLTDRRVRLRRRIEQCPRLREHEKQTLAQVLRRLPQGDRLLHGDFHPANVMWTSSGPVIIDWVDACRGVPEADVARSLVLFGAPLIGARTTSDPREAFTQVYLAQYQKLMPAPLNDLADWHLVTAAARLAEIAAQDDPALEEQVRRALADKIA